MSKKIVTIFMSTGAQIADLFTKALGSTGFSYLYNKRGMHDIYAPAWGGVLE